MDNRSVFIARLAERGVTLRSFDGLKLLVHYDAASDTEVKQGRWVEVEVLPRYVQAVMAELPGSELMFPGLRSIEVEARA